MLDLKISQIIISSLIHCNLHFFRFYSIVQWPMNYIVLLFAFSSCSICSFVKDVRFLCSFLFKRSLSWVSSSALELCSLWPSLIASFIPSLPYSLKDAASEKSKIKPFLKTQLSRFMKENYVPLLSQWIFFLSCSNDINPKKWEKILIYSKALKLDF